MSASGEDAFAVKVVLVGDSAIGAKTSLLKRFVKGVFTEDQQVTMSAAIEFKTLEVDGFKVRLEIWGLHLVFLVPKHTQHL